MGAPEPTGGASESRQAAEEEAADEAKEQAGSEAEGSEAFYYAEALVGCDLARSARSVLQRRRGTGRGSPDLAE